MELGIFAKTFHRPTVEGVLDAVLGCGLKSCQFNLSCAGLPTLPDAVDPRLVARIGQEFKQRGLNMAAISGTFNMIDPDLNRRREGLKRLTTLIGLCAEIGTRVVTLCTGTRDPQDMWRAHPDNGSVSAWRDLIAALAQVLPGAEAAGVVLGIEPEHANVIDSAAQAQRLLNEMGSSALGIIFDAANLLTPQSLPRQKEVLSDAMQKLGPRIVLAHAKDLDARGQVCAVGQGAVEWSLYLSLLRQAGFEGSLVIHGVEEGHAISAVKYLERLRTGAPAAVKER
jgi:sugar phosphate isomerase/epimerase